MSTKKDKPSKIPNGPVSERIHGLLFDHNIKPGTFAKSSEIDASHFDRLVYGKNSRWNETQLNKVIRGFESRGIKVTLAYLVGGEEIGTRTTVKQDRLESSFMRLSADIVDKLNDLEYRLESIRNAYQQSVLENPPPDGKERREFFLIIRDLLNI
jgi:hypothetical protein